MSAKKKNVDSANLELYEKLVATDPRITLKGATHPYTSYLAKWSHVFLPSSIRRIGPAASQG